jgi:hypothetical protein
MFAPSIRPARRLRRVMMWISLSFAATIVIVILLFHRRPSWFRPPTVDESLVQRARQSSLNTADWFGDQLVRGVEFDMVLEDRIVNEWIAAAHRLWPQIEDGWPPEIISTALSFQADRIWIGAHVRHGAWQAVVNAGLRVELITHGEQLAIHTEELRIGALPLPRVLAEWLLSRVVAAPAHPTIGKQPLSEIMAGLHGPRADDHADATVISNDFEWPNGKRRFRVLGISAVDGRATLHIRPESDEADYNFRSSRR